MRHAVLLALASLSLAQPAQAGQVRFTGTTTADDTLIKDALQQILLVSSAIDHCSTLEAVDSKILSPAYKPADATARPEAGKGTYEAWTATLCGKTTKFLITFWPASDGGTMFGVTYPYPTDAP